MLDSSQGLIERPDSTELRLSEDVLRLPDELPPFVDAAAAPTEFEATSPLIPVQVRGERMEPRKGPWDQLRDWIPVGLTATGAGVAFVEETAFWPALASALVLLVFAAAGRRTVALERATERGYLFELRERLRFPGARLPHSTARDASTLDDLVSEEIFPEHLRAGEEVVVRKGAIFPADGTIVAGAGSALLYLGSEQSVELREGSQVAAGGQVITGAVRMICSKTGAERAFASLAGERIVPLSQRVFAARVATRVANHGAPVLAALCGALLWAQGQSYSSILTLFGSVLGAFSLPLARQIPGLVAQNWLCRMARRGVSFPDEEMLDRCGSVTVAVLCARGTVLHGEPDVAEIHAFREVEDSEVLALAAGAESVVHHPIAAAVLRAAQVRGVSADASRSHNAFAGMGVVCVSSRGDSLIVGSRELLLKERISIAMAEETLRSLESRGLTALMVARDAHLVGVLALQDSLRAGAKATVQLLLDEGVEPVLLSGDSRKTTEAVAHALACEHVRPEVAAPLRAGEVRNLIDGGALVAVIGGSPRDDGALGAAQVPIILEGASTTRADSPHPHERGVGLVGNQVIPAVIAIIGARRIRTAGHFALVVCYLPAALGAMMSSSLLGPVYISPLVAGIAGVFAHWLCQRWLRKRSF